MCLRDISWDIEKPSAKCLAGTVASVSPLAWRLRDLLAGMRRANSVNATFPRARTGRGEHCLVRRPISTSISRPFSGENHPSEFPEPVSLIGCWKSEATGRKPKPMSFMPPYHRYAVCRMPRSIPASYLGKNFVMPVGNFAADSGAAAMASGDSAGHCPGRLPGGGTDQGHPVAAGLGVLECGLVGIYDLYTDARYRRQGMATWILSTILSWASNHGALGAYLQVMSENLPALALYRKLGFKPCYRYWYRIRCLSSAV